MENLKLNEDSLSFLRRASGWARFIAIAGFVMIGFCLLCIVALLLLSGAVSEAFVDAGMSSVMTAVYFIFLLTMLVFCLLPMIYLYYFAARVRRAIDDGDTLTLAQSFHSLKNYFLFYGVAIIVSFVLCVLFMVVFFAVVVVQ